MIKGTVVVIFTLYIKEFCINLKYIDIWNSEILNGCIDLELFALKCTKLKCFKGMIDENYFKPIEVLYSNDDFEVGLNF